MQENLNVLNNIKLQIGEACLSAVIAEVLMRLIAEKHKPVQDKLKLIIEEEEAKHSTKEKKYKVKEKKYLNCNLNFLENAIGQIFFDKIEKWELDKLKKNRVLRNKLLHGNFVGLGKKLGENLKERQIRPGGTRKDLKCSELSEAIKSIDRNNGLQKARIEIEVSIKILVRIYSLEPDKVDGC